MFAASKALGEMPRHIAILHAAYYLFLAGDTQRAVILGSGCGTLFIPQAADGR